MTETKRSSEVGIGVDSFGGKTIDPTQNVLDLVKAESRYQNSMRDAEIKRTDDLRTVAKDNSALLHEQIREEIRLYKLEVDRHFEMKLQHFVMLEKSIDERIGELRLSVNQHATEDLREFDSMRREITSHAHENARSHDTLAAMGVERIEAIKALLSQTIAHNERAVVEAKTNLESRFTAVNEWRQTYGDLVKLNVSQDAFQEFKKAQDGRWDATASYMAANTGERAGAKNLWAIVVAAAVMGAAMTSMFQFFSAVQRAPPQVYVQPAVQPAPTPSK